MKSSNTYRFLITLLVSISQFGLSLYLPSLPDITLDLETTASLTQLTITLYAVGIGFSQFIYGPLSDYYGRKIVILTGLLIFLIGTFFAIFSKTITFFLFARLIQGIGIGGSTAISRAILRDIFEGTNYIKAGSWLASTVAITPVVAPVIGGYFQVNYGWQSHFIFLFIYTIMIFLSWLLFFEETNQHSKSVDISLLLVAKNYYQVLQSPIFLKNAICGGLAYSGEVVFLAMAPFLFQVQLGVYPLFYGWILLSALCGFLLGSSLSSWLANRINYKNLTRIGLSSLAGASILMLSMGILKFFTIISIIIPMTLFMVGAGFVYPNTAMSAIQSFSKEAGTASATLSGMQGLIAGASSALVPLLNYETQVPLALMLLSLSGLALSIYLLPMNKLIKSSASYYG